MFDDLAGQRAQRRGAPLGDRRPPPLVRDIDFGEDRSQVRTASGLRIMASLRNLAITILRLAGASGIATALRYHAAVPAGPSARS